MRLNPPCVVVHPLAMMNQNTSNIKLFEQSTQYWRIPRTLLYRHSHRQQNSIIKCRISNPWLVPITISDNNWDEACITNKLHCLQSPTFRPASLEPMHSNNYRSRTSFWSPPRCNFNPRMLNFSGFINVIRTSSHGHWDWLFPNMLTYRTFSISEYVEGRRHG